jgi:hypothetical protein
VTQHSIPHGHGDTIPSIRSESTRTRGNTSDTTTAAFMGTGKPFPPSGQRVQEHMEHTWRNTAAIMGSGTSSPPSGERVQEHVGTHVTQHSSPHGHGDTIPSIKSESTRTHGNTRDTTQQPSRAREHHPLHQVREYKNTWEHT